MVLRDEEKENEGGKKKVVYKEKDSEKCEWKVLAQEVNEIEWW